MKTIIRQDLGMAYYRLNENTDTVDKVSADVTHN